MVIFMSDNGLTARQSEIARFNAGLRGKKGNVYEGGVGVPYPARRETQDRFGLDIKTFMIVDNPSLSWSGA